MFVVCFWGQQNKKTYAASVLLHTFFSLLPSERTQTEESFLFPGPFVTDLYCYDSGDWKADVQGCFKMDDFFPMILHLLSETVEVVQCEFEFFIQTKPTESGHQTQVHRSPNEHQNEDEEEDFRDFERAIVSGARRAGLSTSGTVDLLGFSPTQTSGLFTGTGWKKSKYPVSSGCVHKKMSC